MNDPAPGPFSPVVDLLTSGLDTYVSGSVPVTPSLVVHGPQSTRGGGGSIA
jgi:hypothetical protein